MGHGSLYGNSRKKKRQRVCNANKKKTTDDIRMDEIPGPSHVQEEVPGPSQVQEEVPGPSSTRGSPWSISSTRRNLRTITPQLSSFTK